MKKIKSIFVSTIVALVTATLATTVVFATTYYSEASLTHYNLANDSPITYSSSGCAGSSCRYLNQSSTPSAWRWQYASSSGIYNWYAYCPTIGQAAAKYGLTSKSWTIVMNQASTNNKGTYVYLGYSDASDTGTLFTSNACISGWGCSGMPVYWDNMGYSVH